MCKNMQCYNSQTVSLKQLQQEIGAQRLTNSYCYMATWPQ